jgi:hypothetical protein
MLRALLAALALSTVVPAHAVETLSTVAEQSGFLETGRYEEVERLCKAFAARYPTQVRCFQFGVTPQGRPMLALAVNGKGALTAQVARKRGLPVTLVQGGIHAGEIDGKDAGFLLLRELLQGRTLPGVLDRQVLLFVPVFNVDGHERFGQWNRPNQRGPVQTGWRTTAQNFNLNRDYMKADAPEMQAMLALVGEWDPLAQIDLHVTNGAQFEHDISIQVEPLHTDDAELRPLGRQLRDAVIADLARQGSLPQPFYMSFAEADNPASGFTDTVAPPRFSTGYYPLRNRFAMLVETHSWKDYPTRVRITRNTVASVLQQVATHGPTWQAAVRAADGRAAALAGTPVPLSYRTTNTARTIDFRGYAYTRTQSDVSGALMTRYDESKPQLWRIPLRDEIVPNLVVNAPRAGYLVPAAHAPMVGAKLRQHGIVFRPLPVPKQSQAVEVFRAATTAFAPKSLEGRQRLTLTGEWTAERRTIEQGALFVPISQPRARLAMALLEPLAPDSLAAWGFFNTAFEAKEYMEDYVAEDVARAMLKDPQVAAAFKHKLESDAAFAKDPAARLEFFYRRHASWDERLNLYPVLRVHEAP